MEGVGSPRFCETCAAPIALDLPAGLCPGCLFDTVLDLPDESAAGCRIDEYELLNEVARGGMGIVYRARQRSPSRIVALKMILPAHLGTPDAVQRFRAEAEAAASLDHPGILPIYAVGEHDGAPFYSMKFAEGGTLAARIDRYRTQPREAAALVAKLARAVACAHEHGILHRDLKPQNVLFDAADHPFVSDFGLAKWLQSDCGLTQTHALLGTPFYMAPEQAADARAIAATADVYSLGAILHHLLAGQPPFSQGTVVQVLQSAATQAPRPLRQANPSIPRDLDTICLKCLEKAPAARYPSATALALDLERFVAGEAIQARPIGRISRAWRRARTNPVLTGLGAITLALSGLLVATQRAQREAPPGVAATATKAVAALPFATLGADATGEVLATGLHQDILVSLSKVSALRVIARSSVLPLRQSGADPREIGRSLGVDAVLTGTLRQAGRQARLSVQLIAVADGAPLWTENFDRELDDIFAIQSDLALQIASALKARVLPMEAIGIRRRPTYDPQAYLLFVQASDLFALAEKYRPNLDRAAGHLRQAIERDPKFALAIALLSQVETVLASDFDSTSERIDRARELAERALQLEPDLPEAHLALGRCLWQGHRNLGEMDLVGALREFETARRSLPGNAEIYSLIGRLHRRTGKWQESLANLEKAAALDPNTSERWSRLYGNNLWMRRYAEAAKALEREIALSPNSWRCEWLRALLALQWKGDPSGLEHLRPPSAVERERYTGLWFHGQLFAARFGEAEAIIRNDPRETLPGAGQSAAPKSYFLGLVAAGRKDETKARECFEAALPSLEQAVAEAPTVADRHMALARVYAGLQRKEDALRTGKRACELQPESKDALDGVQMLTEMANIYLLVGEREAALGLLEHSLSVPGGAHVGELRVTPIWAPLRGDQRFQKLLATHEPKE